MTYIFIMKFYAKQANIEKSMLSQSLVKETFYMKDNKVLKEFLDTEKDLLKLINREFLLLPEYILVKHLVLFVCKA